MDHRIQNFESLTVTDLRKDALSIAEAGLAAIDVGAALERNLSIEDDLLHIDGRTFPLTGRHVYFVGVGKCAFASATAIEHIFGERLTAGIALDVSAVTGNAPTKIETYIGTHPLPSEVNENATKRIIEFLSGRTEDDLVIMLISGGGSTLLCLHAASMTCYDESALFEGLTEKGATIGDINTVRKHISQARGGALAKAAYPAEVLSLIVSDVPGNDLESIASGPTVLDTSTVDDARAVLEKYGLSAAANIEFLETPKEPKYFERTTNVLFLSNQDALDAMKKEAEVRGYAATIADDRYSGEAKEVGLAVAQKLHGEGPKSVLLYAGESTVALGTHAGTGGRNQEMALSVLEQIGSDELILPFSSDGHDNSDHAGAVADASTRAHARAQNLNVAEYLDGHRSYDFFKTSGDALVTGYTKSNVSDLIITIKQ